MAKIASRSFRDVFSTVYLNEMAQIVWAVFLIFLTAQITIPLEPVPITLQTFGVLLIGLTFEKKVAIKAIVAYLVLGILGAPVFRDFHGGYLYFMGPTAGYLVGFLAAVIFMTTFRENFGDKGIFRIALNCVAGTIIIFTCGIAWLSKLVGFTQAIQGGLLPFILPGCVKAALLVTTVRYLKFENT